MKEILINIRDKLRDVLKYNKKIILNCKTLKS